MTPREFWLAAAEWGNYMRDGDPGACMYGFDERGTVQTEQHRADCIAWIDGPCRKAATANIAAGDPSARGDHEKLDELRAYLLTAPCDTLHMDHDLTIDQLPSECVGDCGRGPGAKDERVAHWCRTLGFTVNRERAIKCLAGYGAWSRDELTASSDGELAARILWLACGAFAEWDGTEDSPCGTDTFVLE